MGNEATETAVQELERLRVEFKTKSDECTALTEKLSASESALATAKASVETLTTQVADLGAKFKDTESKLTAAEAATQTEKVRADKAEKKLAMDPALIDVAGRKVAVADGTAAGDQGANVLEQFLAMKEGKEKQAFYQENKKEIVRLKNLVKE